MNAEILRIRLLVIVSCLLFFPFTLMAQTGLTDDLRGVLQNRGWVVLSMDDLPVLTPSGDMTFEIRNLSSLAAGDVTLELSLFHRGEPYADVRLPVRLAAQSAPSPAADARSRTPRPAERNDCVIRAGDAVELVFAAQGFVIRSEGRALGCGRKGEETGALNLAFNTVVRGTVADGRRIILK